MIIKLNFVDEKISLEFAQVISDTANEDLPIKSSLNKKYSDLIGNLKLKVSDVLKLDYDFMLDDGLSSSNYNSLKTTFSVNNLITTFEYLEENEIIGSNHYVGNETTFVCVILLCFVVEYFIESAKSGEPIYMRPIAAIKAMEEAVGRATEMGTPVLYVPGISSLDQIDTISGLTILGHVAGMTAEYEANLHVPVCVPIVMETAKETCKESYLKKGRPDLYRHIISI